VTTSCCQPASPDAAHERGTCGAAGGGLSGSERDRSAALRLVLRELAHDAKVRQVSAGLLLLDRTGQLSASGQPRAHAGTDGDRQGSNLAGNLGARR
jgi:hypothetical protein